MNEVWSDNFVYLNKMVWRHDEHRNQTDQAQAWRFRIGKSAWQRSAAFKTMGYSRDSFYHFKMRYENSGEQALPEISRKKSILRNRVPEHVECSMTDLTIENPALGQLRASQELLPQGIVSRVVGAINLVAARPWDYELAP